MPSPFPGMDPYIEATGAWQTFHHAFLSVCADQLNERLPKVELLSPSNQRRGLGDRVAYLAKRRSILHHRVHLVEIDLLLGGDRVPLLAPLPAGDCFTFVTRREAPHECEVYSWGLREPLPTIPVPLEPENVDTPLDLGPAFVRVYDRGRYPQLLRYGGSPPPSMRAEDRAWAEAVAKPLAR